MNEVIQGLYPMESGRDADPLSGLLIERPDVSIHYFPFPVRAGTSLQPFEQDGKYKLYFYLADIPPELIHTYSYQQEANWTTYSPERSCCQWRTGKWTSPEDGFVRIAVPSALDRSCLNDLFLIEPAYQEDETIPAWMREEEDALIRRVEEKRREGDAVIILLADTHFTIGGIWPDTLKSLRIAADGLHPDAVVHLGDFTDGMLPGKLTTIVARRMISQMQGLSGRLLCCLGNHDHNYFRGNPELMTLSDCARLYLNRDVPWYCEDLKEQKVRLLFMDSFDPREKERYGFSDREIRWLRRTLRSVPPGYRVLVFSHVTPVAELHVWSKTIRNGEKALRLLERFHRRRKNAVLGWIHGHSHADQIYRGRAFPVIGIGCGKLEDFTEHKPAGAVTWPRKKGDASQELWDILLIHPADGGIDLLRFGAGEDRHSELMH